MRIASLFSGGKDSVFALYKAIKQGHDISCIVIIKSKKDDSYMFHIPNIDFAKKHAEMMDIPVVFIESCGIKEKELDDLKKAIKIAKEKYNVEGIISGALASNYQAERVKKLCDDLNLKSINPLWGIDQEKYLKNLIKEKFKVIITGIAADGLNKSWLGRIIDNDCIKDLKNIYEKNKINVAAEGGEYETFVLDCPLFKKSIKVTDFSIEMENECTGQYIIKAVELVQK